MGVLNLYASDPDAFRGKEGQLAHLFGVQVNELITDADLGFMTREWARELPQRLVDHGRVNRAIGLLTEHRGWSPTEARERMTLAAANARAPLSSIAEGALVMDFD